MWVYYDCHKERLFHISKHYFFIAGEHGWVDMLTEVGRKLDKADSQACGLVANYLRKLGQLAYAREMYKKVGDFKSVVTLYVSVMCI